MKMNNIKSLLLLGATVLSVACSSDFLETEPTSRVPGDRQNELMLEDPARIAATISGAYATLFCGTPLISSSDDRGMTSYQVVADMLGDDMMNIKNGGPNYAFDMQLIYRMAGYRRPVSMWSQFYYIISTVNDAVAVLKHGEGTNDKIDSLLGQALALRAYSYYWLINFWQHPYSVDPEAKGVPLYLDDATKNVLDRGTVAGVYEVIDQDLKDACRLLKDKAVSKTQISEYTAAGMYANALMFLGRYSEAASYAERAVQGGTLATTDLLSGFNSLQMSEVLFGFNMTVDWNMIYASFMSMMNPYVDGYAVPGYYPITATGNLVDHINPNDIRKNWFGYKDELNTNGFSFAIVQALGCMDYVPNKFLCPNDFTADLIYFRVAEFYFVAAEAYYLMGGHEADARRMLNAVMSKRITGYDCSNLSGQALYDEICFQKRVEMWGEGRRIFDAKRRNESFDRSKSAYYPADLNSYDAVKYSARDQRLIYQIPTIEMDNNEYIKPEDQNE